jgi:predicted glycoside hydrolase/deacetylase ChbG (UPF0249 family)
LNALKRLIVNADDFGFTHDVNRGILDAHRYGIVTATTLMANGGAFDDAVRLARANPTLDIGCHLTLVGGPSLPASVRQLVAALARNRIRIYDELAAQVRRILDAGIPLTHLDTHKHTHLLPPVLEAVVRLAEEFSIPWVRAPFDLAPAGALKTRAATRVMRLFRPRFLRVLREHGCRTTDHFAGFQLTGFLGTAELVDLIRRLPSGTTEFMCHPAYCTEELRAAPTRLNEQRERELRALTSPQVRDAIVAAGVELVSYGSHSK